MPFWRKLHIKATESQDINDMPDDTTRLLWVMLPLALGKEGRGIDNPAWVKAKVMPLRSDISPETVDSAMNWFADRGMIVRYDVNGRSFFYIPTWHDHQSTSKEGKDQYPHPVEFTPTPDEVPSKSGEGTDKVPSEEGVDGSGLLNDPSNSTSSSSSKDLKGLKKSKFSGDDYRRYQDNDTPEIEQLYSQVTQQVGIASDAVDTIFNDLRIVIDYFRAKGEEVDIDQGKRIFAKWCNTKGKSQIKYSPLNPVWIQRWIKELVPLPKDKSIGSDLPSYLFKEPPK